MVVDGALPPTRWSTEPGPASRPPAEAGSTAAQGAAGAPAATRPLVDTVELSGGTSPSSRAPSSAPAEGSPWLERASQVAGAGRGSASGSLGLDVVA